MDTKLAMFNDRLFKYLNHSLRQDILTAPKSMPNLRKEISRVFQVANRRIQNIEKKGEFSPAVVALNKGDIKGYTKFSMQATSWTELKKEYTKAITFLQQPTSTATGTGQYNNFIKQKYDLTEDEYKLISDNYLEKLTSVSDINFVERYLMRYKDFTGDIETEARSVSEQLERDAVLLTDALQNEIDTAAVESLTDPMATQQGLKNAIEYLDEHGLLRN